MYIFKFVVTDCIAAVQRRAVKSVNDPVCRECKSALSSGQGLMHHHI